MKQGYEAVFIYIETYNWAGTGFFTTIVDSGVADNNNYTFFSEVNLER